MFRHPSGRTKVGILIFFFLEVCTLSTYSDVMSYIIREPEIRHVVARERRFQAIYYGVRIGTSTLSEFNKSSQVPTTRKMF